MLGSKQDTWGIALGGGEVWELGGTRGTIVNWRCKKYAKIAVPTYIEHLELFDRLGAIRRDATLR